MDSGTGGEGGWSVQDLNHQALRHSMSHIDYMGDHSNFPGKLTSILTVIVCDEHPPHDLEPCLGMPESNLWFVHHRYTSIKAFSWLLDSYVSALSSSSPWCSEPGPFFMGGFKMTLMASSPASASAIDGGGRKRPLFSYLNPFSLKFLSLSSSCPSPPPISTLLYTIPWCTTQLSWTAIQWENSIFTHAALNHRFHLRLDSCNGRWWIQCVSHLLLNGNWISIGKI